MIVNLLFACSLAVNAVLLWYISKLLNKIFFIQDNTGTILSINETFRQHLSDVNEMEMYFGDQTLVKLLEHSKYVTEQIEIFSEVFSDIDEEVAETEEGT